MRVVALLCFFLVVVVVVVADTPAQRASALLAKLSLDQKISLLHGYKGPYVGQIVSPSVLPSPLTMEDGPSGVADGVENVTCFPSALTVAQSWDLELFKSYSAAMAFEQRQKGTNVMLGPMVNLARVPQGGRNFESLGEDPFFSSRMVEMSVQGIQSQGIMANVKHFVDNNQETDRFNVSANIDMKTQAELYMIPFKAAVDAGVLSIMCSYNRINQVWACENPNTLGFLKKVLGFQYFVVSDWGATHSTVASALAGLDVEMPGGMYFDQSLLAAVQNGTVPQSLIDDKAYRVLLAMYASGLMDAPLNGTLSTPVNTKNHAQLSRSLASQSMILLQNQNHVLPISLPTSSNLTVAVIGNMAVNSLFDIVAGGGSGHVKAPYVVTLLQAMLEKAEQNPNLHILNATNNLVDAANAAKAADISIVVVGAPSTEGVDRPSLSLGADQELLIQTVAFLSRKTVVVIHSAAAVLTESFRYKVSSILVAGYPGQEDGRAVADVLLGVINPSGRLSVTWPKTDRDNLTPAQWPGINQQANYSEKLLIGYRWYTTTGSTPSFPFGHGLSYTTFAWHNFKVSGLLFSCDVQNVGSLSGATVVQLYVSYPDQYGQPKIALKGFVKTPVLQAKQTYTAVIEVVPSRDLLLWNDANNQYYVATGTFVAYFGESSANLVSPAMKFQVQ